MTNDRDTFEVGRGVPAQPGRSFEAINRWRRAMSSVSRSRLSPRAGRGGAAFTLIELILVMALLAIGASLVAPKMASFFRGRALNQEGQRLLALTHLGQSRAVSEGVPVILWFNLKNSTYGLTIQSGYIDTDDRASAFTLDSTLTLEAPVVGTPPVSEQQDERLGMSDELPFIRFNPDGFFDEISQPKIVLRQGSDGALQLVPTVNRFGYEIQPYNADLAH